MEVGWIEAEDQVPHGRRHLLEIFIPNGPATGVQAVGLDGEKFQGRREPLKPLNISQEFPVPASIEIPSDTRLFIEAATLHSKHPSKSSRPT